MGHDSYKTTLHSIGGDLQVQVDQDVRWETQDAMHLQADEDIIFNAEDTLTLQCGNSTMTLEGDVVTYTSPDFGIGENPAAGPNTTFAENRPILPGGVLCPKDQPESGLSAQAFADAEQTHASMVRLSPKVQTQATPTVAIKEASSMPQIFSNAEGSELPDQFKKRVSISKKQEFVSCNPESFFYKQLLKHEGGFVNHPNDPGGATNKGVTILTWKSYSKKLFGISPTVETLKEITNEQAYQIFVEGYWKESLADKITNCPLAFQFVDFYYNAPVNASKSLQSATNQLGQKVIVDGFIGNVTLAAVNHLIDMGKEKELYRTLRQKRIDFYNHQADSNPRKEPFRKGWIRRANSFQEY